MSNIAKYNICKGISTVLTMGTPITVLAMFGDFFLERPSCTISATGVFAILIAMLFFKDKIAENWKTPSEFVVALIVLLIVVLVENILVPIKYVCIATIVMSGVDEVTFKRIYKTLELELPEKAKICKHFGFIFATSKNINKIEN